MSFFKDLENNLEEDISIVMESSWTDKDLEEAYETCLILADDVDSDLEECDEEEFTSSDESSSSESEEDGTELPIELPVKRCRTRGGRTTRVVTPRITNRRKEKEEKEKELENQWEQVDHPPNVPKFTSECQVNATLPESLTPLDCLSLFFDDKFYTILVTETNRYAKQHRENNEQLPKYSRAQKWKDVTIEEMKEFLGLYFLTGVIRKPELNQYWSQNPLIKTSFFNENMPRNRFQTILQFLHFNDNP